MVISFSTFLKLIKEWIYSRWFDVFFQENIKKHNLSLSYGREKIVFYKVFNDLIRKCTYKLAVRYFGKRWNYRFLDDRTPRKTDEFSNNHKFLTIDKRKCTYKLAARYFENVEIREFSMLGHREKLSYSEKLMNP